MKGLPMSSESGFERFKNVHRDLPTSTIRTTRAKRGSPDNIFHTATWTARVQEGRFERFEGFFEMIL